MSGPNETEAKYLNSEVGWTSQGAIDRERPVMSIIFLLIYSGFFALALVYVITVKIPTRVDAVGRLTSEREPVPIRAPASFVVGVVNIKENQVVAANQVLLFSRENLSEVDQRALRTFLGGARELSSETTDAGCGRCLQVIPRLSQSYLNIRAQGEIQSLIAPINDLLRELLTAAQAHRNIEPSIRDLRLRVRLNQQKLAEIRRRNAEQMLAKEVEDLSTEVVTLNSRIQERIQTSELNVGRLRQLLGSRLTELSSKLELFGKTFNVVAPFAGRVTNLRIKGPGELISSGETLMELVPANSELVARIEVRNEDISKVAVGQEAIVSVDALPQADYGTVKGQIIDILRSEEAKAQDATATYPVLVKLAKQSLEKNGESTAFILGMGVRARVVSDYQPIYRKFLNQVLRVGERAGVN